jgi:hypothetical protein
MCIRFRLLDVMVDDGCSISPRHFNFEQIHSNWEYVMGLEMEMKLEREKEWELGPGAWVYGAAFLTTLGQ